MLELSFEYMNKLANQTIFISALLGGFSLTLIATLLESKTESRIIKNIFLVAILTTTSFLISVFSMTKILMMTTKDYPIKVTQADFIIPKIVGVTSFFLGIIFLLIIIGLAGWTKSKSMGITTTIISILSFVLILFML